MWSLQATNNWYFLLPSFLRYFHKSNFMFACFICDSLFAFTSWPEPLSCKLKMCIGNTHCALAHPSTNSFLSCWMQTCLTNNYHTLFCARPISDRLKKAIKVDKCIKAKLLRGYFHRDKVLGNPKLTLGMPMHLSTTRWYTCITFPYRLLVHHFHFDIAGDVELINIDCESRGT